MAILNFGRDQFPHFLSPKEDYKSWYPRVERKEAIVHYPKDGLIGFPITMDDSDCIDYWFGCYRPCRPLPPPLPL
jgi:hypothetical protein